jgi:glycosyltransferase involved in cell wall biosynthesis
MRILFVSQRYHPFVGGVETQSRLMMNALSATHHVDVAAAQVEPVSVPIRYLSPLSDTLLLPSFDSFDDGDIRIHSLAPSWSDKLRMLPVAVRATPRLQRYYYNELREATYRFYRSVYLPRLTALAEKADVVHCVNGGFLGWAAQEAARAAGVPFVITPYVHPGQHGDDARNVAFYRDSDAVLALLETDREMLVDLGVPRDLIHLYGVVPLLPETADPVAFRERHGIGDAPMVLFVGRAVEYKGIQAIRDATGAVWAQEPDTQFVFVGPVSDAMAAELSGHDERMHVLGFVSKQEKADAYAACTVFCMPSRFEILPAVYLEAWSYGKPVVGGPAHGLRDLIEGNGAGVVAEQTGSSVAHHLLALLSDPDRAGALGRAGQEMVAARYSVDALVSVLESVYTGVQRARVRPPVLAAA